MTDREYERCTGAASGIVGSFKMFRVLFELVLERPVSGDETRDCLERYWREHRDPDAITYNDITRRD